MKARKESVWRRTAAAIGGVVLLGTSVALGAGFAGVLDPTFGGTGVVVASGMSGNAVAIQQINGSERYLVAGQAVPSSPSWIVLAYTPNGSLDPTFGARADGTVRLFNGWSAYDVSIDGQNRVVMGGTSAFTVTTYGKNGRPTGTTNHQGLTVVRLTPDGRLDTSFNGTGIATVWAGSPAGYDELGVSAVAVPPSLGGGILAAGSCYYAQSPAKGRTPAQINRRTFLAKFRDNGTLDPNFGTNGIAYDPRSSWPLRGSARLQRDGKIVVAHHMDFVAFGNGTAETFIAAYDWVISRFSATGQLDTTFATGGRAISSGAIVHAAKVNPADDSIVAFGDGSAAGGDGLVARYLANGALDPAFGINGYAPVTGWVNGSGSLAIQPDGRVVVCGHTLVGSVQHGLLARFAVNGLPDTSFGGTGYADPLPGAWWLGVAEAAEGIVVSSWAEPGSTFSRVARYGK